MEFLPFALGAALLAIVSLDILFTTIGADEHAIVSFRIGRPAFRAMRAVGLQRGSAWMHRFIGPFIMFLLATVWILGVSFGWALIFAAFPGAVDAAAGAPPPGWWDVYGHVGHLLSTLGLETTTPGGTASYVFGALVAVNGFVLVTLATSFIVSTTQTVVRGRAFASLVCFLDPADPKHVTTIAPELAQLCSSLRASPFALFYSSPRSDLRLPEALQRFATRAAEAGTGEFHCYRGLLGQLPSLEAGFDPSEDDAAFLDRLSAWARRYSFG